MSEQLFHAGFDQLDLAILEELQVDGRMSVADLARKIHLSPPAVYQRIKRMERAGVIRQYVALIDRDMTGYDLLCFIRVSLQPHTPETIRTFERAVTKHPRVMECYRTAGSHDVLLKCAFCDHKELDLFLRDHIMTLPGVQQIDTSLVLQEMKATTAIRLK